MVFSVYVIFLFVFIRSKWGIWICVIKGFLVVYFSRGEGEFLGYRVFGSLFRVSVGLGVRRGG